MAKNKKIKSFELSKEIIVNKPASEVWQIAGPGFTDAGKWATAVDHSEGKGEGQFKGAVCDERSCDLNAKGFNKINEKITQYSEDEMMLEYEVVEGMPKMMAEAKNQWTIIAIDEHSSKIIMKAKFGVQGFFGKLMIGMMKNQMNSLLDIALNDIKVYTETGNVSKTKQERINKLAKRAA